MGKVIVKDTLSGAKKYILSTMTDPVSYTIWRTVDGLPVVVDKITIAGGAGLPSKRSGFGDMSQTQEGQPIWTARGVVTPIPAERLPLLEEHWLFKKHKEGGFVEVVNQDITDNHKAVSKIVRDMTERDGAAQLNNETWKDKVKVSVPKLEQETGFRI